MKANKLKLNPEKTHMMLIGTKQGIDSFQEHLRVKMGSAQIAENTDKCELLLGCTIQCDLKWNSQISMVSSKLSKRISALSNLQFIMPFKILKQIAEGVVNSILVYCLPLYGGSDTGQLRELQILQNKAARIVFRAPPSANRDDMFKKLKWMSVNQLVVYHSLILIFRIRRARISSNYTWIRK